MKINKYRVVTVLSLGLLLLTPVLNIFVNMFVRQKAGVGSECLLWLFPLLVLALYDSFVGTLD
ncbi:hypothetical protein [Tannockella kyphosi]|uniref:hypothetical protein n=1 Tax=Tannockella kyphosi TaxID=2899121 RepID=UPI002012C463|nr:hypothetical protein [Tannockella kyphosi]